MTAQFKKCEEYSTVEVLQGNIVTLKYVNLR